MGFSNARLGSTLRMVLLAAVLGLPSAAGAAEPERLSIFLTQRASADARKLGAWVVETGDHQSSPFLIIDKVEAKLFAFSAQGVLVGVAPVLLGLAKGDNSPAGIGTRKLSSISPAERITPAGRFVAAIGKNLSSKDVLWIDYDAAISLHRVDTTKPRERRLQRLATPVASDNRISYGCINVPKAFYENVVAGLFKGRTGIVYILPEAKSVEEVFLSAR